MDLRLLPQQQLKVTPKQIAANYILQLSSLELQDVINQELEENPALEQEEPLEGTNLTQRDEDDDEFDPIVRAEAEQTLAEWLSWNVRVMVPTRLHAVVEYLIGNLNENGYLEVSVEDAAAATHASVADVEEALRAIQSVEPFGLGARDTRECLLIQMERLAELGEEMPAHARGIVADHYRDLGEHKFGDIAQALRITREDVRAAWDYIKDNLNPFPAHAFAAGPEGVRIGGKEPALRPDVLIVRNEQGKLDVEVIESRRFQLRVNPVYRTASLATKDVIKGLIEGEDRSRPLSDQEIVAKLRRDELRILPARLRKGA